MPEERRSQKWPLIANFLSCPRVRPTLDIVHQLCVYTIYNIYMSTIIAMTDFISSINVFLLRTPFTLAERARYSATFESFPLVFDGALIGHNVQPVS